MMAFDSLLDKAQLSDGQALSCFLAGLKHELKMVVRMFSPQTLQAAYSLAKLQDALKKDPEGMSAKGIATRFNGGSSIVPTKTVVNTVNPNNISVSKQSAHNIIARRPLNLTPKQLEERRLKNQCFWCEEKFSPGHRCKNRQLYSITVQDKEAVAEEEPVEEAVGDDDQSEVIHSQDTLIVNNPYLSLHALEGIINFQTMRVRGSVGKRMLCVLMTQEARRILSMKAWPANWAVCWRKS